tara:strand:+ start:1584 stop:1880 length:297 start_codon:yes stop_codon:yes gene_type:complete
MSTNFPHPGMKVFIESDAQILEFLDTNGVVQTVKNVNTPVSNYEYEERVNEGKRSIQILRPEYIGVLETDMRNMMQYSRSSQYVSGTVKRTYNPRTNS